MSMLTDVGVSFKMQGADSFESRLKSLESQWKSFSGSFNQTPQITKHFEKMTSSLHNAERKITKSLGLIKAAAVGILAAKGAGAAFEWGLGSEAVAKKRVFAETHMDNLSMYEQYFSEIRDKHQISKDDLIQGAFEINSALSNKPEADRIEAFKVMAYYATELGVSFSEAAVFYKQMMAAFGSSLPLEQQKTFAVDFLGKINQVSRESSANPDEIKSALSKAGPAYGQKGWSTDDLLSHLAYLIPVTGSPEIAGNILDKLADRAPQYSGTLAKNIYREKYVRGQVQGQDRDWGSYANLEFASKSGNELARRDMAELSANEKYAGDEAKKHVEKLLASKKPEQVYNYLNKQIDVVRRTSQTATSVLEDTFGEYSSKVQKFLGGYTSGEIDRIKAGLAKSDGQAVMNATDAAKAKQLPELWGLVKQKSEDFSGSLRTIFYEPMRALLEEWKLVFTNLEKSLGGENGLKKIQGFSGNFVGGYREARNQGQPVNDNRSLGQIFQDFVSSLSPEDFRAAGKMLGKAATDFVTIAGQLKEIIGSVHSALSYLGIIKPLAAAALMPGPWPVKAFAGVGVGVHELSQNEQIKSATEKLDKMGIFSAPPFNREKSQGDLLLPAHRSSGMIAPPDNMATAHTPGAVNGNISARFDAVNISTYLDGDEIAKKLTPRVADEVQGRLEADRDRNRGNAMDRPFNGTN